jgi:carbonic anhydrase
MATIDNFIKGYKKFREEHFKSREDYYQDLVTNGQSPQVMMITCSDSRINVPTLLNVDAGELFSVRNVANLIPSYRDGDVHLSTTAALEFAVKYLEIQDIIVMGHSNCGGIAALMQTPEDGDPCSITSWVSAYTGTRHTIEKLHGDKSIERQCFECEKHAILQSLQHLAEYPWIQSRIASGKLNCHGWYYDLAKGLLYEVRAPDASLHELG